MSSRLLKWFAVSKQSQNKQVAQLSQKDRVAEWVSYSQKWKTGTGRQCLRTLVYLQPLWRNWPAKQSYSVKRMRNNGYYTAQGHSRSSRSVSIESPYANSNWHLIWYRFGVIAVYYSNFGHFAFLSHRWGGGLRDSVRCSSWKARSGLPINVNWSFFARYYGWTATSDYLFKIGDFTPTGVGWP